MMHLLCQLLSRSHFWILIEKEKSEGLKFIKLVLHYLETLRPHLLLEQMVCTAFRASADTPNQATFGGLKQMVIKMGQLYLTMASTLKHLQVPFYIDASLQNLRFPPLFLAANRLSVDSEITEDVKRLCVVFEHVEKLLTIAASLHRKFLQAPRLSEVIFSDYYDFYLPTMGTGTVAGNRDMFNSQLKHLSRVSPLLSSSWFIHWSTAAAAGVLLQNFDGLLLLQCCCEAGCY
ncbi:hypothetical protein HYC85_003113 [Camellia sinensis]|uniref:Uncharacterized protein n=1 Tax=Camellia sinensis TaxID=4442 RepID=A0A7J7IBV0_CAMSI|nr:hypothetical protein HYC85_003113 [Camellia sinensis]